MGHNVSTETVLRRFNRSLYNFFHLYRPFLDSWVLFDNSGNTPNVIAKETNGVLTIVDNELFDEVKRSMEII
jgi:predicted ABC-type ATPase